MKVKDLLETSDWDNAPEPTEDQVAEQRALIKKQIEAARHEVQVNRDLMGHLENHILHNWSPKYRALISSGKYFPVFDEHTEQDPSIISSDIPNAKMIVHSYTKYYKHYNNARKLIDSLVQKEKDIQKKYRNKQFAGVGTTVPTKQELEDAMKHPEFFIGKTRLPNPLLKFDRAHWVGKPEQYPDLTGSQKDSFMIIQDALKVAGLQPLSILYGARAKHGGINFVAMNSDRTIGWHKYEPSKGAGANNVAVKNVGKVNTGSFIYKPAHYLDKMK